MQTLPAPPEPSDTIVTEQDHMEKQRYEHWLEQQNSILDQQKKHYESEINKLRKTRKVLLFTDWNNRKFWRFANFVCFWISLLIVNFVDYENKEMIYRKEMHKNCSESMLICLRYKNLLKVVENLVNNMLISFWYFLFSK